VAAELIQSKILICTLMKRIAPPRRRILMRVLVNLS